MDAVILLHKPVGMTSFAAVHQCRKILHEKKSGHTGTLDPNASGLLIVLFGKYTKYLPYCAHDHKHYIATFRLGLSSDTEDIWGTLKEEPISHIPSMDEWQNAADVFEQEYNQVPPMYSAIKKDGRKLYEYARKGIEIERQAKRVQVNNLVFEQIDDLNWRLEADVSSGTYIRTLITDLAHAVGEHAVMTSLVRTSIEQVLLSNAVTLEELEAGKGLTHSIEEVMDPQLKQFEVSDPKRILSGMTVRLNCDEPVVLITHEEQILAAYEKREDGNYHSKRGLF